MKKFLKNLKNASVASLVSLIFTNGARAQSMPNPVYGVFRPTSEEMLARLLPFIAGIFLVFVVAPIAGLIWYRKRGGIKKWPKVVVWILTILFVAALSVLIIFIFFNFS